jgi:mRNA interferase MazF
MSFLRGDILLADILYSDRSGSKRRPVLVVSADANNAILDDIIAASISSMTRTGAFTHVLVDPAAQAGQGSGLLHTSYVQCENLFVLDRGFIVRKLGQLSRPILATVNDHLKAALDLP